MGIQYADSTLLPKIAPISGNGKTFGIQFPLFSCAYMYERNVILTDVSYETTSVLNGDRHPVYQSDPTTKIRVYATLGGQIVKLRIPLGKNLFFRENAKENE